MTKFQFVSELLNIVNGLLETGVNGCNNHETRTQLDHLFDEYEEHEGVPTNAMHDPSDLELYAYIVDNLHEKGYSLWLERKVQKVDKKDMATILNDIDVKEMEMPKDLKEYFNIIENLENGYIVAIDESEGDHDAI